LSVGGGIGSPRKTTCGSRIRRCNHPCKVADRRTPGDSPKKGNHLPGKSGVAAGSAALKHFSDVATRREDHRSPRSDLAVRHRRAETLGDRASQGHIPKINNGSVRRRKRDCAGAIYFGDDAGANAHTAIRLRIHQFILNSLCARSQHPASRTGSVNRPRRAIF
jgi:hypothetical protein